MSRHDGKKMMELLLTPEEAIELKTVTDWFSPEFTTSVFLAVLEHDACLSRLPLAHRGQAVCRALPDDDRGLTHLRGILHTEYNEFDSIIKPIHVWLKSLGVQFRVGASITDISLRDADGETIVTGLTIDDAKGRQLIALTRNDLVFFTNGSLTQNATMATRRRRRSSTGAHQSRLFHPMGETSGARSQVRQPRGFSSQI